MNLIIFIYYLLVVVAYVLNLGIVDQAKCLREKFNRTSEREIIMELHWGWKHKMAVLSMGGWKISPIRTPIVLRILSGLCGIVTVTS